jgi:hypothetical protein
MTITKAPFQLIYIILCQDVTQDAEKNVTLHNVIGSHIVGSNTDEMPPCELTVKAVLSFYLEDKQATYTIQFALEAPDGQEIQGGSGMVGRVGDRYSPFVIATMPLILRTPGTYWVKVYHGKELMGHYPLTVGHEKIEFHEDAGVM